MGLSRRVLIAAGLNVGVVIIGCINGIAVAQVDKGLLDCRVLPDPTSRLFCYDRFVDGALANPGRVAPVAPVVPVPAAPVPPAPVPRAAPAPVVTAPVAPVPTPAPVAKPVAPAQPAAPVATPPVQKFGEENLAPEKREQPTEAPADTLRARVTKVAADPYGATIITLDNGQVWKQAEGSKYRISAGAGVTISRGMLGAFS